ncbi:MAG: NAD(P)H-binding protein [Thermoguttaceae bacterium]|jgi:NADH dehydrogenase
MLHAVTGAYGYSGKYIARRLLDQGHTVVTLTNSPGRPNPFGEQVRAMPFHFDRPDLLAEQLRGVAVLYNTYWVRFNHRLFRQADAVRNTLVLFEAARKAGVRRIVHVSIVNASADSPLEYFRSKARLEKALVDSGLSYAILRPAVLFGKEDVLVNNIAWTLRWMPLFAIFGDGRYRLQPIYVEDLAELAVRQGSGRENTVVNAIGPETFTYRELVATIGRLIGKPRPIVSVPPWLGYAASRMLGLVLGDVLVTRDEIRGLMAGLLCVEAPPAGPTALTDWVREHADSLGRRYASELARRKDRSAGYEARS